MRPAARAGDLTMAPHIPPRLNGSGSPDVQIGGKAAWRASKDKVTCSTPLSPATPTPHGTERCFLGSLSVMINNQMAVRQGDILIGKGPPNMVMLGKASVLIGDFGFGMADPDNMAEFCADFGQLMREWDGMPPKERRARLEKVINKQVEKSGAAPLNVVGDAAVSAMEGAYNFTKNRITIGKTLLDTPGKLRQGVARKLANILYHEGRHAEQIHHAARYAARRFNKSPANLSANMKYGGMGLAGDVAKAAGNCTKPLSGPQKNLGKAVYGSVFGRGAKQRGKILDDLQDALKKALDKKNPKIIREAFAEKYADKFREYRSLAEEQDAWQTGDSNPCGAPPPPPDPMHHRSVQQLHIDHARSLSRKK